MAYIIKVFDPKSPVLEITARTPSEALDAVRGVLDRGLTDVSVKEPGGAILTAPDFVALFASGVSKTALPGPDFGTPARSGA